MKVPYTWFSTEFRGGARQTAARLKNLMAGAPPRQGIAALVLVLAVVAGIACLVSIRTPARRAAELARTRFLEELAAQDPRLPDFTPWQENVGRPDTIAVRHFDEESILFTMDCEYIRGVPETKWFLLERRGESWRFAASFRPENPRPDPGSDEAKVLALLTALPDGDALIDRRRDGVGFSADRNGNIVVVQRFMTDTPGVREVLLGLLEQDGHRVIGDPLLVRVDDTEHTFAQAPDGTLWYLYASSAGEPRDGGALYCDDTGWHAAITTAPEVWSHTRATLRRADAALEFSSFNPRTDTWTASYAFSYYNLIHGQAPEAVQKAAMEYATDGLGGNAELVSLASQGWFYGLSDAPVEVYRLEVRDRFTAYLVFSRPKDGVYEYLGGTNAREGIMPVNAAIQRLFGIHNMDFALIPNLERGYYGLGGADASALAEGKKPYSTVRHDDWEPLYGAGGYWEEQHWYGNLYVLRYVDAAADTRPAIYRITTTLLGVSTSRGIQIGDSREKVLERYPEAGADPLSGNEGDSLQYGHGLGDNLIFHFTDGKVSELELVSVLD